MERLLIKVYSFPIYQMIIMILAALLIWSLLGRRACAGKRPQSWRALNFLITLAAIGAILFTTILSRGAGACEVDFMPFRPLIEGPYYDEYPRTLFMNVLLFVPFGVGLAWTLGSKWRKTTVLIVTLLGLALSIFVEYTQLKYQLGSVEADDLIMNTLGALLGGLTLLGRKKK